MINFFTLAFVASTLSFAAAEITGPSVIAGSILAPLVEPAYEPLQPPAGLLFDKSIPSPVIEKRTFGDFPNSIFSQVFPVRTRKAPEMVTSRFSFKRVRVHRYLSDTLNAILPHSTRIRYLCAGANSNDAEKLSWALVAELRSILQILNGCLYKVKDCGTAPTPSGTPGGRTPTLDDICQLFFKILCEIRECCKLIGSLCIKYQAVRRVCQDTLKQINSCLSSIAITCGVEVGNLSTGLGRLCSTIPRFFADVQFGFSAFPSILGNGYGSFSFNASL